eukprot:COSAG02_NODE_27677_length_604_cov_9.209901_1_plen_67_part_01
MMLMLRATAARPSALVLQGQSRLPLRPLARCLSAAAGEGGEPPVEDLKRRSKELTGVEGTPDWSKRS